MQSIEWKSLIFWKLKKKTFCAGFTSKSRRPVAVIFLTTLMKAFAIFWRLHYSWLYILLHQSVRLMNSSTNNSASYRYHFYNFKFKKKKIQKIINVCVDLFIKLWYQFKIILKCLIKLKNIFKQILKKIVFVRNLVFEKHLWLIFCFFTNFCFSLRFIVVNIEIVTLD